jgi:hypothetical protein
VTPPPVDHARNGAALRAAARRCEGKAAGGESAQLGESGGTWKLAEEAARREGEADGFLPPCALLERCPGPPGRCSALGVFHSKASLYGAFVCARRALSSPKCFRPAQSTQMGARSGRAAGRGSTRGR